MMQNDGDLEDKEIWETEYHCIWFAKYYEINQLIIPKCKKCGSYMKLLENDNIPICRNNIIKKDDDGIERVFTCNTAHYCYEELKENIKNEAIFYNLDNKNQIFEFEKNGSETVPFNLLPSRNMRYFGLYNIPRDENYAIDLFTGEIIINGTRVSLAIPESVNQEDSHMPISFSLKKYGDGGDLIHFKRAVSDSSTGITKIKSFNIGYKCKVNNFNFKFILTIDTKDFKPHISTKYSK